MGKHRDKNHAQDAAMVREVIIDVLGGAAAGGIAMIGTVLSHTGLAAVLEEQGDFATFFILGVGACTLGGVAGFLAFLITLPER
jgi:hypothetical protein